MFWCVVSSTRVSVRLIVHYLSSLSAPHGSQIPAVVSQVPVKLAERLISACFLVREPL